MDEALGLDEKKKTLNASERDQEARAAWRIEVQQLDPQHLVFVDECGSHLALTREYARSPRGDRAVGSVPRDRGANVSLIAALSAGESGAGFAVEGAVDGVDGEVFEVWVEQIVLPWLRPGQTVIWDNLRVHYRCRAQQLIEQAGCRVIFLPAYSPDFSPIEQAFSKLKAHLKAAAARTIPALLDAIAAAIRTISPHDISGWFNHCGYPVAHSL